MKQKKCFVISPIGDKDSDIRKHADSFLKLLVQPSLSEFDFDVIRADQIVTSSVITNDIVEYVQQSELCIVDLTFHNPNVFYECGRRHENGKATIQMIKKGEKLPFDVAGIRTIEYNLADPWTTLESVNVLKDFIRNLEDNDAYGDRHTGVSLTSIAQTLNRIEKTIGGTINARDSVIERISKYDLLTLHPWIAFKKSFERGDMESARFLLTRLRALPSQARYLEALSLLATAGDMEAKQSLLENGINGDRLTGSDYVEILSGLKNHYYNTDTDNLGFVEIRQLISSIERMSDNFEDSENALIFNYIQTIAYNAENYDQAIKFGMKAIDYAPNIGSIWYNISLSYKKSGKLDEAENAIIQFVKYSTDDFKEYHIGHIKEVLEKTGKSDQLEAILKRSNVKRLA